MSLWWTPTQKHLLNSLVDCDKMCLCHFSSFLLNPIKSTFKYFNTYIMHWYNALYSPDFQILRLPLYLFAGYFFPWFVSKLCIKGRACVLAFSNFSQGLDIFLLKRILHYLVTLPHINIFTHVWIPPPSKHSSDWIQAKYDPSNLHFQSKFTFNITSRDNVHV